MLKMAGLMIAAELAQGCLVQLNKNLAQFFCRRITGGKTLPVNLTQRADEGVSVLVADFAVVVAVPAFAYAALHGESILPPGPNGNRDVKAGSIGRSNINSNPTGTTHWTTLRDAGMLRSIKGVGVRLRAR